MTQEYYNELSYECKKVGTRGVKFCLRHLLIIVLIISIISPMGRLSMATIKVKAAEKTITIGEYIEMLITKMKIPVETSESNNDNDNDNDNGNNSNVSTVNNSTTSQSNPNEENISTQDYQQVYIATAVKAGILKSADEFVVSKAMTRAECAVLTNRADIYQKGKLVQSKCENIVNLKRIADLNKIDKSYQADVIAVFAKGIIIGYSKGKYSQDREFRGNNKITYNGAKDVINKLLNIKLRKKMSPDGQLIRTTNLPKNYKAFDYILEAFPNSFYEMKFAFQYGYKQIWDKKKDGWVTVDMVEMEDYARPCKIREWSKEKKESIDLYLYDWCEMVGKNLKYRFNVDYRTIGDKWFDGIRHTYTESGSEEIDSVYSKELKDYIKNVKKHKIIIKAQKIVVEPSTFYTDSFDIFRCYVKFKIISCDNICIDSSKIIFSDLCNLKLTKGKYLERYFDIEIAPSFGSLNYLYAAQSTRIARNILWERKDAIID